MVMAIEKPWLDPGAIVVQDTTKPAPLFAYDANRPRNPASVMKLVTTFAALEILGPDYRWKTEAYLGGPLVDGELRGDLILKGYGDPKITVEQWQSFIDKLRANGLVAVDGDLALAAASRCRRTIRLRSTTSRRSPTTSAPTRCSSTSSRCA